MTVRRILQTICPILLTLAILSPVTPLRIAFALILVPVVIEARKALINDVENRLLERLASRVQRRRDMIATLQARHDQSVYSAHEPRLAEPESLPTNLRPVRHPEQ